MFDPYNGPWTFEEAAHLLRRTTFGPTKERILQAVNEGFDETFDTLFAASPPVDPPIYYDYDADPEGGIGETWVDKPLDNDMSELYFQREKTLWAWWFMRMKHENQTINEKLTLFWHNHFVIAEGNANMKWYYLETLRQYGQGNFRELTKKITVDKGMLVYLNGASNIADEPNENYARELLELFTIGKGDLVAPGDYTNYTEQDVAAIARALTGWRPWNSEEIPDSFYANWAHDQGTKQLSHRFDNIVIQNSGDQEYKEVIDIIFQKDEVAFHICRKLYLWFVHYHITLEIENEIITPMAEMLIANDYEIRPVLIALLKSQHFYDSALRGCMIKNPLDFFFSIWSTFKVPEPVDFYTEYKMWLAWYWEFESMGMAIFRSPSVAGWPAYHQAPSFYRDWVNSASLALRKRMMNQVKWLTQWVDPTAPGYDWIGFIATLENPLDINDMIDEICKIVFPRPMTAEQKEYFKFGLLQGLPDFEWTDQYGEYLADPTNEENRITLFNTLNTFFFTLMNVPEFQMS